MLVLKLMSSENKSDYDVSKCFSLICCDNVYFDRLNGDPVARVVTNGDTTTYHLDGNAYVMEGGVTIAKFSYSEIEIVDMSAQSD